MLNADLLEIPIRHGSDFIYCYDATGFTAEEHRPPVRNDWSLELREPTPPRDLRLLKKNNQVVFFRSKPDGMQHILAKEAATFEPPIRENFAIHGRITTVNQHFNPRDFSITAGEGAGHGFALYRSPLGTTIPSAGALIGTLYYEPEDDQPLRPAAWAILTLVVTPTVGNSMAFTAQADAHGDFILPLNRIPALNKDAPASHYPAVLSIRAAEDVSALWPQQRSPAVLDPDDLVAAHIANTDGNENFLPLIALRIIPGQTRRLVSYNKHYMALRIP